MSNENSEAASDLYFNRFPECRHPDKRIFKVLKSNIMNNGSFKKPRAKNYAVDEDNEMQELNIIGKVLDDPNNSHQSVVIVAGVEKTKLLRTLKKHKFKP